MKEYPKLIFWLNTDNIVLYEAVYYYKDHLDKINFIENLPKFKRWRNKQLPKIRNVEWLKEGF